MFSSKNIPSDQTDNKDKLTHVEVLKNNYKELLQSEQNLFTIFKNIPAIVFAVDRNYRILYINHVPEGLNIDETIGTDAISYVAEEHRSLVREKIDSVFNTGNHADYEISARGPENTMSWYETHLVPNVENGSVQSVILITDDITKHIKIENSLKISEERWRSLVSDAPDIILTLDRAYKILYINHTAPGITPEESIGRNVFDFVPPDYQTTVKNTIDGVFQTGKQGHYHTKVEVIKNAPLWYSTRVSAVLKDNTIDSVMLITRDITEQKKLTEEKHHLQLQLERSQRMESIGRITGGIAHDFNNILSIILLNAELASDHGNVKSNSYLLENINEIKNSCIRARDLISQMLAFSKPMKYKEIQSSVNLELFFEEIKKVLRSVLPSTIQIDLNLPADLPEIDINPVKLQQIIINLSINAADAMKNSGILKIHAEKQTVTNQICNSCQQCFSGDYTVIKISDTGHGIKPELVDKIFEPFFTTKEVGKGSGMGLSMVHGALHECGGHIHLETDEIGTEFNLFFQSNKNQSPPSVPGTSSAAGTKNLSVNVVVIDDEISIVNVLKHILEKQGLKTVAFSDPFEAKSYIFNNIDTIDLVITDQTMPNLTGMELGKEILEQYPDLPVILTSGFSDEITDEKLQEIGFYAYAEKPLNLTNLFRHIQTAVRK